MAVSIEIEREQIDVSTRGRHVPDPEWSHVDSHRHTHRFDGEELPTLEWVVTGIYWCADCRDEHEEGEWRCRECGDVVEPSYRFTGPERAWIPGLTSFTLLIDGFRVELREDQANALLALEGEAREVAAREIAADNGFFTFAAQREP